MRPWLAYSGVVESDRESPESGRKRVQTVRQQIVNTLSAEAKLLQNPGGWVDFPGIRARGRAAVCVMEDFLVDENADNLV